MRIGFAIPLVALLHRCEPVEPLTNIWSTGYRHTIRDGVAAFNYLLGRRPPGVEEGVAMRKSVGARNV